MKRPQHMNQEIVREKEKNEITLGLRLPEDQPDEDDPPLPLPKTPTEELVFEDD